MITVTERAIVAIKESIVAENKKVDASYLRVSVKGGGCSGMMYHLSIESDQNDGDSVIEQGDVRIVLFVRLRKGAHLDDGLKDRIRAAVRSGATPRHVPACILGVPDIPRTISGKIVELAVSDVIHGREIHNRDALANPEALDYFTERPEIML